MALTGYPKVVLIARVVLKVNKSRLQSIQDCSRLLLTFSTREKDDILAFGHKRVKFFRDNVFGYPPWNALPIVFLKSMSAKSKP